MRRVEPDPVDPGIRHSLQKRCKPVLHSEILAVCIHVLSKQGDFLAARRLERLHFRNDIIQHAGTLPAARIRHDTVCAELVAAVHDIDKCFVSAGTLYRQLLHNGTGCAFHRECPLPFLHEFLQKIRKTIQIMCSEHQIDLRVRLPDPLYNCRHLGHAAAQGVDSLRV